MLNYQYVNDYFVELPDLIKWVYIVSILFVLAIFFLIIYLKVTRYLLSQKDNLITRYKREYEAILIEYLYSEKNDGTLKENRKSIVDKLKNETMVTSRRKSVISILSGLLEDVSGEISDSIKDLYKELGFVDYAIIRLNSRKWHIIAKAIGELRIFKIEKPHNEIIKFISHPRQEVREEAQLYLVNIFKFEGLNFLNNLKSTLSEWEQILLLDSLLKFDEQELCDIRPWLKSKNNSVVLFALKLAKIYNQLEVKNILYELLSHQDKEVRVSAIDAFKQLFGLEVGEILIDNYNDTEWR